MGGRREGGGGFGKGGASEGNVRPAPPLPPGHLEGVGPRRVGPPVEPRRVEAQTQKKWGPEGWSHKGDPFPFEAPPPPSTLQPPPPFGRGWLRKEMCSTKPPPLRPSTFSLPPRPGHRSHPLLSYFEAPPPFEATLVLCFCVCTWHVWCGLCVVLVVCVVLFLFVFTFFFSFSFFSLLFILVLLFLLLSLLLTTKHCGKNRSNNMAANIEVFECRASAQQSVLPLPSSSKQRELFVAGIFPARNLFFIMVSNKFQKIATGKNYSHYSLN